MQAAVYGFGPLLRDPASVQGFVITQPYATCMDRGHPGRADVCGYRMCVGFNAKNGFGGYVGYQTYTLIKTPRRGSFYWEGGCTVGDPWEGNPPVAVREFCKDNPKHSACKEGFREDFKAPTLEESVAKPEWMLPAEVHDEKEGQEKPVLCSDEFKDKLRAKGMSYRDISEVCKE